MSDHLTDSPTGGIQRRTIVAGASWTIPVVATAIGAPLAAASGDALSLAFSQPSYSGGGCGSLSGVTVTATKAGSGVAGRTIAVTLPAGFTFQGGGSTHSATSGDDGSISLPPITLPAAGGSGTLSASSGTTTATASISATANTAAASVQNATPVTTLSANIPAGSDNLGFRYFLAPNGDLYYFTGDRVATGVTTLASQYVDGYSDLVTFQTASGTYSAQNAGPVTTLSGNIPLDSTAVGFRYFLAPDGDLYYFTGDRVATGVTTAASQFVNGYYDLVTFQTASGTYSAQGAGPVTTLSGNIPLGSTNIDFRYFLAPNGDLYYFTGDRVATGVTTAAAQYVDGYYDLVTFQTASGTYSAQGAGPVTTLSGNIPLGSDNVDFRYFLAPNGDLYYFTGDRVATGVATAAAQYVHGYSDLATFTYLTAC
ncbi:hypothetical protein [Rathayibacter sp. SD072]|uniref:hypothetical protein n=1 Tax=Rathayibacter sp. SD072 TaxID=2781731 RepID=UPI001A9571F3|nr:hypothetical protein [Rathayibacter sp. SD072]MBO0984077.1 hypothetical protein [Rathayibacter sp. SD072]